MGWLTAGRVMVGEVVGKVEFLNEAERSLFGQTPLGVIRAR